MCWYGMVLRKRAGEHEWTTVGRFRANTRESMRVDVSSGSARLWEYSRGKWILLLLLLRFGQIIGIVFKKEHNDDISTILNI